MRWLVLAAAVSACSSGQTRVPKSDGERVYLAKCAHCHRVYEPSERTPAEWERAVAKMERLKKVRLDPSERALILGYLTGSEPLNAYPAAR